MVTDATDPPSHSLEQALYVLLGEGRVPAVADLGGLGAIVEESSTVATSPLAGEVLAALLREPSHASEDAALLWRTAVGNLVRGALTDTVLLEMIDAAHVCENLPEVAAEEIFTALLQKAVSTSGELSGYARAVALEGAFRFALSSRRRQLRLLSALLNITLADGPEYLRYAAKILGVAHSHWREDELVNVLTGLVDCEEAAYEATFELGMAALTSALDEPHRETAARLFAEALRWFRKAQSLREHAPEALLYVESLTLLTDFAGHRTKPELAARSVSIHKAAFELVAWHTDDSSPAWLGARHLQASCWNNLASVLISLVDSLDEVSWWEPAVVIESQVLAAYSAGRTVLKRNREGYLETLLRPRIEASIGCREGHAYLVKRWALQNHQHALIPEAHALLTGIERTMFHAVGVSRHPSEAGTVWAPVAAVLSQARCSPETENRVKELITNAFTSSLENLSGTEIDIFDHCRSTVEQHPDHRDNVRGAKLFDTVLLWTVRFLKNRLEMTKKDDAGVAYLFENVDGALPPESALQDDYFRWLSTQTAAGEIEATNLGSGRADVALKTTGERIVIEVKRELQDASFDALAKSYAGQTCDYQNVSIRLGFLLVLDLTEAKRSGTPHMRALVECRPVVRANEDAPRYVVIVKVPGRRYTPHAVRAGD